MSTIRFPAEVDWTGQGDWRPCTVRMGVEQDRDPPVYDVVVTYDVERRVEEQAGELASIRERVGRIAKRLEDVTAELRMLSEGLSPEESSRTLERIEESLGIGKKA